MNYKPNFENLDNFNNEILMELGKIQLNKVIFQIEDLGVRKPIIMLHLIWECQKKMLLICRMK